MTLNILIKDIQKVINNSLNELVPDDDRVLTKAIRYSLLCKGKRLRPLLVRETANIFYSKENNNDIIIVASAIEMIHIFSLIHDDLPSMDNDDYRRGELTCHKKFNEYDAILAGDSLILLAIETIISKTKHLTFEEKCKIVLIISEAIGYNGMCLGQSLDIEIENNNRLKTIEEAEEINTYKTGYLFKACIEIGCILGKANENDTKNLIEYSLNFGKAFQLMDDLEDDEIEKKDIKNVRKKIEKLVDEAKNNLKKIKNKNDESLENLKLIADFCLRNN